MGLFDDLLPDAGDGGDLFGDLVPRKELPDGVTPSTAGAGRGGQGGPTAEELAPRRGGTRRESRPFVAAGDAAPAGVATGALADSALQRAGRESRDPMLRPEFVEQVRGEFAAIPETQRLPALRKLAELGTDARARAALVILADVETENAQAQDAATQRPVMAGILANAARAPIGGGSAPAKAPPVAMPEVGRIEQIASGETDDRVLERARGGRAVAQDQQSIQAIAGRAELAGRDFDAEAFTAENPMLGALAAGGARQLRGAINIVPTAMDFAARLVGIETAGINSESEYSAALKRAADSYMPKEGRQDAVTAWERGEFGGWLTYNLIAQAPQIAQSVVAAFVPGAQGVALAAMGAGAAGNKFADTGSSIAAVASGAVEAGSELLPLKALERIFGGLKLVPAASRADVIRAVGAALPKVGAAVGAQAVVGAIEEGVAQVGNNIIDNANGERKALTDGLLDAMILGAAASGAMSGPKAVGALAQAAQSPDAQIAAAIDQGVANTSFTRAGIDGFARAAMTPGSVLTDPNAVRPEDTRRPVIRAEEMPTTPFTPEQVAELRATAPVVLPDADVMGDAGQAAPAANPSVMNVAGATPESVGIAGVGQGTLATAAEQRLRENAQGNQDVEGNQAAEPQAAAVPTRPAGGDGLAAGAGAIEPIRQTQLQRYEASASAARTRVESLRAAGLKPESSKDLSQAELDLRSAEFNRDTWANMQAPKDGPELQSFNAVATEVQKLFGRPVLAYVDQRGSSASDGFAMDGKVFINLANPEQSVAFTVFHELQHVIRAEAKAGNAQSQLATRMLDQVWGMISPEAKQNYARQYLFRAQMSAKAGAAAMTMEQALANPMLKDEMLSDFMGKRATDATFWRSLATKEPTTFKAFVQRWSAAVKQLVDNLRGMGRSGNKDIDRAIANLERAKLVAEKVVREWAASNPQRAAAQAQDGDAAAADDMPQSQRAGEQPDGRDAGVAVEVAPNPDQPVAQRWRKLGAADKEFVTREVMDNLFPQVLRELGWPKATYSFGSGTFEGEVNPSITVSMPGASFGEIDEMARVLGYLLDQKAMVAFDEGDTTGGSQAGFVKVIPPAGMSTEMVDSLRRAIAQAVPQASGDSVRGGAIVYGNFSQWSDAPLDDQAFYEAIATAAEALPAEFDGVEVKNFGTFRSEYIEPGSRDAYLEGTRYGKGDSQQEAAGRDAVRGRPRGDLGRLQQLAQRAIARRDDRIGYVEGRVGAGRAGADGRVLGAGAAAAGSKPKLSYGKPRDGATAIDAWHFSREPRSVLSSAAFGTGLQGNAREVFLGAADKRLAQRIHFYLNRGEGVHPEAGVGGQLHRVLLRNLYDADKDALGFRRGGPMSLQAQSAIADAGFDGFFVRGANRAGMAVLIGQHAVPVEHLGLQGGAFDAGEVAPAHQGNIWYSRRDSDMGYFSPFQDLTDPKGAVDIDVGNLTEADIASLNEELNGELSLAPPGPQKLDAPSDAVLQSVGIMAEAAYKPLEFGANEWGTMSAGVTFTGQRTYNFTIRERNDASELMDVDPPALEGIGVALSYRRVSEQFGRDASRRIAASIDLMRREFDLFTAVPAAARKRVMEAWQKVAKLKGAMEFGRARYDAAAPTMQRLQQVADSMLAGTRFGAKAEAGSSAGWYALELTDRGRPAGSAELQYVPGADRRFVLHTQNLDKGSGAGKTFYQVAFAFAHSMGVPVNADPAGLTGVNTYRRTEQMMSAAVRAGVAPDGIPGVGQRIYGWNKRAKDDTQRGRNLVRIALAAARNAAELVPETRDLTYDLATNSFGWRAKTKHSMPAEQFVAQALKGGDARAVSVSRSTLARAAITFGAIDGTLKIADDTEVASPVLYSARGDVTYAEVDAQLQPVSMRNLAGLRVRVPVDSGGETREMVVDAEAAIKDYDRRAGSLRLLVKCLRG